MHRRTLALLGQRGSRKMAKPSATKSESSPFQTNSGKFDKSFEKVMATVAENQEKTFKVTDDMYDLSPADKEGMKAHGKQHGDIRQKGVKDAEDLQALDVKPPFERIYNPETLRTSSLSEDYYYPEPLSEEIVARRRRFGITYIVAATCLALMLFVLNYVVPPSAKMGQTMVSSQNL
jgi:hypothetical protein